MTLFQGPDQIKTLRREFAWEAIEGAITQLSAAGRFLTLGNDDYAANALQRGIDFVKLAAPEVRALAPPKKEASD